MDVSTATFEREVIEASRTTPVVVDFWAPWCGPCRALSPVLEKLEREYAGRFRLAKVNSDENPDLAAAFAVRSIPSVFGFRGGRPVGHFLGALPESQVRAFVEKLLPSPAELERACAAALRESGDAPGAVAALRKALELDPGDDVARLDLAALLIDAGASEEAERLLGEVRPDPDLEARTEALRAAAGFSRPGADEPELKARLAADPADHESRLALARRYAGARRYQDALEELLEILRRDKAWRDGEARKQFLNILNLAPDPSLVSEYRRKLASALY